MSYLQGQQKRANLLAEDQSSGACSGDAFSKEPFCHGTKRLFGKTKAARLRVVPYVNLADQPS
ncbi:MAG: hypothetical protein H7834_09380 [Magnetococcus sp. YQC-9]